jgi:plastocyanin
MLAMTGSGLPLPQRRRIGGCEVFAKRLVVGAALPAAVILGGCSGGTSSSSSGSTSPTPSAAVSLGVGGTSVGSPATKVDVRDESFFYRGSGINPTVAVKVGDIVEWDWVATDRDVHNVTLSTPPTLIDYLDPKASSPTQLSAGAVWQIKFTKAGTYGFVCTLHSATMTGLLNITQ